MRHTLRQYLAAPTTLAQIEALAAGAPASAPVSLRLPLGRTNSDWLALLPATAPYWYRARPATSEYRLAIGHALHVASAGPNRFAALDGAYTGFRQHWRRNGPALAFAGFAFDTGTATPLPNALLAIPAILLESLDGESWLTISAPAGRVTQALADYPHLIGHAAPPSAAPLCRMPPETLADRAWIARVNAALRDIKAGQLAKVVLARSCRIDADSAFSAAHVLARLIEQQPDSLVYAHGCGQTSFLGATPERLVCLRGNYVEADALAGTAWPGSQALDEAKNRHEQSLVVRAVREALAPCCGEPVVAEAPQEHPAGRLTHWRSRVTAQVRPGISLFDLVRALHPTPAVGGYPIAAAQTWLSEHREQRAGWYSGGIGILTPDGDGEFSVALRSALIEGNTAELQAGAGIVAASNAQHELAETEAKLGTLLAALTASATSPSRDSLSA